MKKTKTKATIIVACTATKSDLGTFAQDLYQSDWFKKARQYAETHGANWFILSAEHGLIDPMTWIEPYEKTIQSAEDRARLGNKVIGQINQGMYFHKDVIVLAPARYVDALTEINFDARTGSRIHTPLKGLGIGQQKAWLKRSVDLFSGQIGLDLGVAPEPVQKIKKALGWAFDAAQAIFLRAPELRGLGHADDFGVTCKRVRKLAGLPKRKLYALLRRQRPATMTELCSLIAA